MAEGTYEYECMRAELLGIGKPDYEEFLLKQTERAEAQEEEIDNENLKEAVNQEEELKGTSGKLDDLNNILAATQKKIDRFKFRCGSVTELIKTKIGSISGGSEQSPPTTADATKAEEADASQEVPADEAEPQPEAACAAPPRKTELTKALDNHVDKLDMLLEKAENAQYSMSSQNKQMRKYVK